MAVKALPQFLKKKFQLRHSKNCKKVKNAFFKESDDLCFDLSVAGKQFFEKFENGFQESGYNHATQKFAKN